mgnify:FL=1
MREFPKGLPTAGCGLPAHSLFQALSPYWSVSIEEWFYLLWAPIVLIWRRSAVVAAIACLSLLALLFRVAYVGHGANWYWYGDFFCRLDTLLVGAGLALWLYHLQSRDAADVARHLRVVFIAGWVAMALLVGIFLALWPFMGREVRASVLFAAFGTPLIGLATAGGLAWLLYRNGSNALVCRVLRLRAVVWVGRRSYMIYLSHVPMYWLMNSLIRPVAQGGLWLAAGGALVLTLGGSAVSWMLIEAPLLGFKRA